MARKSYSKQKLKDDVKQANRYIRLVEYIFFSRYKKGVETFDFSKDDLIEAASKLGMTPPKNPPDVLYTFRSRGGKSERSGKPKRKVINGLFAERVEENINSLWSEIYHWHQIQI